MIEKLKKLGIKEPQIEHYEWGIYWYDAECETNKEGHIEGNHIYIWPWDQDNFVSGKPVLFCQ